MIEAQAYDVPTALLNATLAWLVAGEPVGDPPLALEAWQVRLVRAAVEELGGAFDIRKLTELTGVSRRQIENLAPAWERQRLLEPVEYDGGHKTPRRVTSRLQTLAQA